MQDFYKIKDFSMQDDAEYIHKIKQKEIHENLANHPLNRSIADGMFKVGAIPETMSSFRAEWLVKKLKKSVKTERFVQVPVSHFDAYSIQKHAGYYSSFYQRNIAYNELLNQNIDVLVLSLAEVDTLLPEGLEIAAITERQQPEFTLVYLKDTFLAGKDEVGVFSLALAQQLRNEGADYWCVEQKYNYKELLNALKTHTWKAGVMPYADYLIAKELEEIDLVSLSLSTKRMVPPAGQGALALVIRKSDVHLKKILQTVHHAPTAEIFSWEKKATPLFEVEEEKMGAYLESKNEKCYFHLYNPHLPNPFRRSIRGYVGEKKTGVEQNRFHALIYQIYGEITLLGLGTGGVRQLSIEATQVLKSAHVVYTLGSAINHFSVLFMPKCKLVDMEQEKAYQSSKYLLDDIRSQLVLGLKVVIALPGDPFFLNGGSSIARALAHAQIPFKLLPGNNALFTMGMEVGIPLLSPGFSDACHIFDCRTKKYLENDYSQFQGTLVFYAKTNQIANILRKLEKDCVDAEKKCAYIVKNQMGGEVLSVAGRLGTYFRQLNELQRTWDGYFVVGDVVASTEYFDFKNVYKHPLSEKNILLPMLKKASEMEKNHIDRLELLGATVTQFKMGDPVLTKKCKDNLKTLLQQMTSGGLRFQFSKRISLEESNKKSKISKSSPLQSFHKGKIWLVFQSPTSVELFFKLFKEEGYDMRLLAAYSFAVLNKWTFRTLGEHGIQADLQGENLEQLAFSLLKASTEDDYILSFNYEAKPSIFDAILKNEGRKLLLVGVYEQQVRIPPKHQLYKLFENMHYILLYDVQVTMLLIQAMIQAGFDHAMVLEKEVQFVAGNEYVYELLASAGFRVKKAEEAFGYRLQQEKLLEEEDYLF